MRERSEVEKEEKRRGREDIQVEESGVVYGEREREGAVEGYIKSQAGGKRVTTGRYKNACSCIMGD